MLSRSRQLSLQRSRVCGGDFLFGFDEHGRRDRDAGVVTRTALAYTAATRPSAHGQQQQQQRLSQQQQLGHAHAQQQSQADFSSTSI